KHEKQRIDSYVFWDELPAAVGLASGLVWHFHPISFIEAMRGPVNKIEAVPNNLNDRAAESVSTSEEGPGKWVTQETDYHGIQNTGQMLLNRLFSLGDEGRLFGSEGKDYENTKRTLIQEWIPLTADEENLKGHSAMHRYGEIRRIEQTFLEGPDNWQVSGKSWHWQPVTANTVYELKGAPV
ncbi:hypothetical protein NNO07_27900, partial [Pseudomonas resinovorans]|nr:hypothetical protein [Pseudomonas resinovorans]